VKKLSICKEGKELHKREDRLARGRELHGLKTPCVNRERGKELIKMGGRTKGGGVLDRVEGPNRVLKRRKEP